MSIESWKKEFYPISADEVKEKDAVEASLKKWRGLLPKNLEKHNVRLERRSNLTMLIDKATGEVYINIIGVETCALCTYYYNKDCTNWPELMVNLLQRIFNEENRRT